jgi:EAL domain-containing protein (putative c-di-GMP-specific phosphodiesterase class I)
MKGPANRPAFVSEAIFVDEAGIEYGVYSNYSLRSAFQPIFRREGPMLVPFAVEGLIAPRLAGKPVPPLHLFGAVPSDDRLFVESMCRGLHLRNHHNIGVERLELFFNFDPLINCDLETSLREIRFMARWLAESRLDPELLVCEITEAQAREAGVLTALMDEMRAMGIRIAIDDFGAGHSTVDRFQLVRPDFVKIDGGWFRGLQAQAARLFPLVVAGFQELGAKVLVEGIETADELQEALDAGVDCLQVFIWPSRRLSARFSI